MTINWKEIAPSRADWDALREMFTSAGLPHTQWHNGVPIWTQPINEDLVQEIADSYAGGMKPKKAKQEIEPEPIPEPKPKEEYVAPQKRGRGRPKKSK